MHEHLLVTGGSGLLGSYFLDRWKQARSHFAQELQLLSPTHQELELTNLQVLTQYFATYQPQIVIHFAAHRNATTAEAQRGDRTGTAWQSNVVATENLARLCAQHHSYLIHISSDYVFSGNPHTPGPYPEEAQPTLEDDQLSWYGITKRQAEHAVFQHLAHAAILRINNVTRPGNTPHLDYVGKILWLYENHKLYPMFNDQKISLTSIVALVNVLESLLKQPQTGIFHIASTNTCTPHQLANYVIEQKYHHQNYIPAVSIDQFLEKHPHRYPKHGGLASQLSQIQLGMRFQTWQEMVHQFLLQSAGVKASHHPSPTIVAHPADNLAAQ